MKGGDECKERKKELERMNRMKRIERMNEERGRGEGWREEE
jgi:hypothetical protein